MLAIHSGAIRSSWQKSFTHSAEHKATARFTLSNLAPGTYRVVAVGPDEWAHREEPGVVAGWLAFADDIALSDQTATIAMEAKLP